MTTESEILLAQKLALSIFFLTRMGEPLESSSRSADEDDSQDYGMRGEVGATSSLKKVEQLLLRGQREEAVQEALSSNNFAMALLVASMCDRSTFQNATKEFADEILSNGSPLHTLAMLFSGQLQPPADSALDRTGTKPSIWDNELAASGFYLAPTPCCNH